jgi:hypothetical protein
MKFEGRPIKSEMLFELVMSTMQPAIDKGFMKPMSESLVEGWKSFCESVSEEMEKEKIDFIYKGQLI